MARQSGQAQQPKKNRIPSGYDGGDIPTDFHIPSCGIEDVDTALFNLFDRDLTLQVTINDDEDNLHYKHKVPVVFSTGERFALRQRAQPIKDKSGVLILPIISVRRIDIDQSKNGPHGGYGLAQNTGDLVIKKKLSSKDRAWQNIINKEGFENQDNVSSVSNFLNEPDKQGVIPGRVASRRSKFPRTNDQLLKDQLSNSNIVEIITMPFPKFFTGKYEITIWTSYAQHMNEIIEKILTNYDGQGNQYRVNSDKGYWFVAYFDDNVGNQDNLQEFTDESRIFKTTFQVMVPGYMIANQNGGDMVPFRRYISAPQLSFEVIDGIFEKPFETSVPSGDIDKFILNDVNDIDATGAKEDGRDPNFSRKEIMRDPFSGEDEEVFVRVKYRNARKGETTVSSKKLFRIDIP